MSGSAPLTVNFSSSTSSGNPTDWQWNFDDGSTEIGSPTVTQHASRPPGPTP